MFSNWRLRKCEILTRALLSVIKKVWGLLIISTVCSFIQGMTNAWLLHNLFIPTRSEIRKYETKQNHVRKWEMTAVSDTIEIWKAFVFWRFQCVIYENTKLIWLSDKLVRNIINLASIAGKVLFKTLSRSNYTSLMIKGSGHGVLKCKNSWPKVSDSCC